MLPRSLLPLLAVPLFAQSPPLDAAAIMTRVAANVETAAEGRRQYIYDQTVRSSLVRRNGQIARKERREYSVFPAGNTTEKKLVSFSGEYQKGKQMLSYSKPGFTYKEMDIDGEIIHELTGDLVNEGGSRDGIPTPSSRSPRPTSPCTVSR